MTDQTVLWIALSAALSLGLVWLQYFFRSGKVSHRGWLATLRFIAVFALLLLLVDPSMERTEVFTEKFRLLLLYDNSASIQDSLSNKAMAEVREVLEQDAALRDRFEVETYAFGTGVSRTDTLDFEAAGTDIDLALRTLARAYPGGEALIVLATDGNENVGRAYTEHEDLPMAVFPVALGDTTRYRDVRIDRINTNRYAFLGNQYPVEILYTYEGETAAMGELRLLDNGRTVHRQALELPSGGASGSIEVLLRASETGLHRLRALVTPLPGERNAANNSLQAGLEVVDERMRIGLVSRKAHPDIGALRRSIESNQQREFRQLSPEEARSGTYEADLLILYEPDASFRPLYQALAGKAVPTLTIAGPGTDWRFLNQIQGNYQFTDPGPAEELLPERNAAFSYFDASSWQVGSYPPLEGQLGSVLIFPEHQELLGQRVRGISLNEPLLVLIRGEQREGLLLGSGLWKWRMHEFRETGSFENFDALWGKIWLFLSGEGREGRLTLDYQPIYEGQAGAFIRARFFDESYAFDPQSVLQLQVTDSTGGVSPPVPMTLRPGYFESDLSDFPAGTYRFTVSAEGTEFTRSGQFSLQGFDLEAQHPGTDAAKLGRLAEATGGRLYFPNSLTALRDTLLGADRYRPIQKSRRNVVSLIDFRWLLGLIVLALSAEWFIRKYHGSL